MANFGKFFGLNFKKKPSKLVKNQGSTSGQSVDDSDDDEGYQDPSYTCSTVPPPLNRGLIPNYPPPRPSSPKASPKVGQV